MAPRIESLSSHRIAMGDEPRIFVYGTGFHDVTGVQVGSDWAEQIWVDGDTVITVQLPHLTPGTTNWVIVHTLDGASPCEGDAQLLTVDAITDAPPAAALTVDAITPDTIALGRTEPYWVTGKGLSQVNMAVIGSNACRVESYDDERVMVYVPENLEGVADGSTVELEIFTPTDHKTLSVTCHGGVPQPEEGWPMVMSVEPDHLGADGGRVVVTGVRLSRVVTMSAGTVDCTVDTAAAERLEATVPALGDHVGERLPILVTDGQWASPESDVAITVDG